MGSRHAAEAEEARVDTDDDGLVLVDRKHADMVVVVVGKARKKMVFAVVEDMKRMLRLI